MLPLALQVPAYSMYQSHLFLLSVKYQKLTSQTTTLCQISVTERNKYGYTHLHRIVFVEDGRSRASKMINLVHLHQQWLSDICQKINPECQKYKHHLDKIYGMKCWTRKRGWGGGGGKIYDGTTLIDSFYLIVKLQTPSPHIIVEGGAAIWTRAYWHHGL